MPPKKFDLEEAMTSFMEKMTNVIQEVFERQIAGIKEDLQEIKSELKKERELRQQLQEENVALKREQKYLNGEVNYLLEKMDDFDQERRNLDVVIENVDEASLRDKKAPFIDFVNQTLMGKVIGPEDLSFTRIKHGKIPGKITLIGVKCQ